MPRRLVLVLGSILAANPLTAAERTDLLGDPLPPGAVARLGTKRLRHVGAITALALTPDGSRLVSAGEDGKVCVWDVESGKELRRWEGDAATLMALSPDGRTLAVADRVIRLQSLDGDSNSRSMTLRGRVTSLAFSWDGASLVVTTTRPDTVKMFEVRSGREQFSLASDGVTYAGAALSRDGRTLAVSVGNSAAVMLYDVATRHLLGGLKELRNQAVQLIFAPDGEHLMISEASRGLAVWDLKTRQKVRRFMAPPETTAQSIALSGDGASLAASYEYQERNRRGNVRRVNVVWDVRTGRERYSAEAEGLGYPHVALNRDGKTLALGSAEGMIQLRDVPGGVDRHVFEAHRASVGSLAFAPDGRTIATGSGDGTVRLWDVASSRPLRVLRGHRSDVPSLDFSPDGRRLATAGDWDGTFRVWDPVSGDEQVPARHQDDRIFSVAYSPDGGTLAVAGQARIVRFFNASTGAKMPCPFARRGPFAVFSPDGSTVAVPGVDESREAVVHLMDLATGRERVTLGGHRREVAAAAFSADSRLLATVSQSVRVWETVTGRELFRFDRPDDLPGRVAFSPDGRLLAVAGQTGVLHIHELITGREVKRLATQASSDRPIAIAFSPDGRLLAASSGSCALLFDVAGLAEEVKPQVVTLSGERLNELWNDLAGSDARAAHTASWALAGDPAQAVPFLRQRLSAIIWPTAARLNQLIAELNDARFARREAASRELARFGEWAEPALRHATNVPPETGRRIEQLLKHLDVPVGEPLRIKRVLATLERCGTASAYEVLRDLAERAGDLPPSQEARWALKRLGH